LHLKAIELLAVVAIQSDFILFISSITWLNTALPFRIFILTWDLFLAIYACPYYRPDSIYCANLISAAVPQE
jgi:hypothetical protein